MGRGSRVNNACFFGRVSSLRLQDFSSHCAPRNPPNVGSKEHGLSPATAGGVGTTAGREEGRQQDAWKQLLEYATIQKSQAKTLARH